MQRGYKRLSRSSETARPPQEPSLWLVPDRSNIHCACSLEGSDSPPTEPDLTHLPVVIGTGFERSNRRIAARFVSPIAVGRYSFARNLQRLSQRPLRRNIPSMNHTWHAKAACQGLAPEIFYPTTDDDADAAAAKAVCAECQVREPCLEFALAVREKDGVWGGATERERRRMIRQRRRTA